ncbi:MAG: prephenate dehydratase [Candidatus Thermoplasmatota archaeon]|nr:prephenate dehydratase [Candidatus Thermoplasmatota archaeon]
MAKGKIEEYRKKIDTIDTKILDLIKTRCKLAQELAAIKSSLGIAIIDRARELEALKRIRKLAEESKLDSFVIEQIFKMLQFYSKELQAEKLKLEKEKLKKIAVLGPKGSNSQLAAEKYTENAELIFAETIPDVFALVEVGKADCGIVPIENSLGGAVGTTLDLLWKSHLKILNEIIIPVRYALVAKKAHCNKIAKIASHEQALEQCREYLRSKFSSCELICEASTSKAAERASKEGIAAIAQPEITKIYDDLEILENDIQDVENITARFVVIAHSDNLRTGNDKTSIIFSTLDRPGALFEALEILAKLYINMTRLESRPSTRKLGEYIFYVDIEGHRDDELIKRAFELLEEKTTFLKILGSYPKAKEVR